MKYSINGTGFIVAERDIYSLGGFIPKGKVGGKIASEAQLSQDGECWLAGGDISGRPDIVIKDNAYVGTFTPGDGSVHTDGITEFSGNTLIPGNISVRSLVTDTKNNVFIKDSFIGISLDVLCGPEANTTAFPFGQGRLNYTKPAGTPMADAAVADENSCFSNKPLIIGKDTQVYVPSGVGARVLWAYRNNSNVVTYSGESKSLSQGLNKISHMSYGMCFLYFTTEVALNPERLLTLGAKILGHINGSLFMDIRPESVSGQYVMDKSSILMNTDNFGLATTQLRRLAGSMYDTNMYTPGGSTNYKVYGTFHNVQRLEYTMPLGDTHKTNANRDRYVSAYDCPLLRIDNTTYNDALAAEGDLTLRRCIVPKAEFQNDAINGNTYEDIDFSYANEDLGYTMTGYARFISSHKQGIYRMSGGPTSTGFVSHKGNLADTARLFQAEIYSPLDGNIIEQGTYSAGIGQFYEEGKSGVVNTRIRTGKPVSTWGLVFPVMPSGYVLAAAHYLDEGFKFANSVANPTGIDTTYPYVVFVITKTDPAESALATEFIALNRTLRIIDHTKAPEITGSAYVGAGVTVRGDVKLIGDPYVNRVLDVNMWERGSNYPEVGKRWDETFLLPEQFNRFRLKGLIPVEPGGTVSRAVGGKIYIWYFDENGTYKGVNSGWVTSVVIPNNVYYVGAVIAVTNDGLVTEADIAVSGIKYVRAFKKRRYITSELDRTSPEDILIGPDYWEQGVVARTVGEIYSDLKQDSPNYIRLRTPVNTGENALISQQEGFAKIIIPLDASTKCRSEVSGLIEKTPLLEVVWRKDPTSATTPADISSVRMVIEFTPSPRIVVPYGSSTLFISGPKIRMYDNAVLSRNLNQEWEIVLSGDAVMGYDFNSGSCMCSNGHSDAIIKLP